MSVINYDIDDVQYIDVDFHNITQTSTAYAKQYDTKTRYIVATVWKDGMPYTIPSGWDVTFRATKPDGKGILNPCIIEDGKIIYQVTTQTTTVDGMFDCEFSMSKKEGESVKTISCPKFRMRVESAALTDDTILSTDEVTALVDLIKEAQELIEEGNILTDEMEGLIEEGSTLYSDLETSEAARVAAENIRVTKETDRQAKESARVTAETGRASAETNRVNAESARVAKEATRVTAETDRVNKESARVTAESGRVSAENIRVTAENTRNTKETERQSAEATRVSNELTRVTKENARITAETDRATAEGKRAIAETDRVNKESARATAETARDSAETIRKSQETTRQSQETIRQSQEATRVSQETARQNYYNAYKVCEEYSSTKAYVVGNKVTYQGSLYQNIKGSTGVAPTNTTNWILIAAKGVDGAGGDMFKNYYDPQNKSQDIFAYADKIEDRLDNQIGTASGSFVNLPKSFNGGLSLEVQGKSVQNGTPTPTTPVAIQSVGDNGSVVVRVTGKNLIGELELGLIDQSTGNPTNSTDIFRTKNFFPVSSERDYFINNTVRLFYYDVNKIFITSVVAGGRTFKVPANTKFIKVQFSNSFTNTQLELGTVATSYEPYKEQLVTIPLTQPLRSVGSVYDRIINKDGVWKIERPNMQEVIQNNVQLSWLDTASIGTSNTRFTVSIGYRGRVNSSILTNRFESTVVVADAGGNAFFKSVSNSVFGILTTDDEATIRNKIITWFSSNPTVLIYPTKTTVYDVLPQDIQDALNKLQTYQGVTNIFTTDTLQSTLSVSYGKTDASALALYGANVSDNKVDKTSVANNLITTVEGTVLDGRQGKALNDKIGDLSSLTTTSKTDLAKAVNEVKTGVDNVDTNVKNQIGSANGSSINLQNGFNGGLLLNELQGKSTQNGVPTPDAKVDIVSVGDNGSVVVKVTGKNLIQNNAVTSVSGGVTFTVNTDKSITATGTRTDSAVLRLQGDAQNVTFILRKGVTYKSFGRILNYKDTDGNYSTIPTTGLTPTKDIALTSIYVEVFAETSLPLTIYPMLYVGEATTYEPYKEQLVTIPLVQPLRSVGSVYDRGCVKVNGVWGNERKVASVVFDGSDNWTIIPQLELTNTLVFNKRLQQVVTDYCPVISNRFLTDNSLSSKDVEGVYIYANTLRVRINKSRLISQDNDGFKTWLQSNPITVQYQLATPTFEPYPQSVQDQLNKLQTYQGVTNVFTTDALQPVMSVSYGKTDTSALSIYANNVSDSKLNISQLPTSLPANGGNADTVDNKHASDFMNKYNVGAVTTFDTFIEAGVYRIQEISAEAMAPVGMNQYGQLLVLNGDNSDTITQIYCNYDNNAIFSRSCHNWGMDPSNWTQWGKINDGGDAYSVGGYSAYELGCLDINGTPYIRSIGIWLESQWNGAYFIVRGKAYQGDVYKTQVDNSILFDGVGRTRFSQHYHLGDGIDLNSPSIMQPYTANINEPKAVAIGLDHSWWHIRYSPHINEGYGMQIAFPLNSTYPPKWRKSYGTVWQPWRNISDNISVQSTAPSSPQAGDIWIW